MSSKGQLVIPATLRRRLDLASGDRVIIDLDEEAKELRLRKAVPVADQVDQVSTQVAAWISPGTAPLADPRSYYRSRHPERSPCQRLPSTPAPSAHQDRAEPRLLAPASSLFTSSSFATSKTATTEQ
jgi:AbrB family looped-hinge helix DNA binding protein